MIARVPASSANLGPGFDTLALALTLYADVGLVAPDAAPGVVADSAPLANSVVLADGARLIDAHHPASVAFARAGGVGRLWERCPIPSGRGLGFSGAVRVAGALLGLAQRSGSVSLDDEVRHRALEIVGDLEGHADNAAASLFGGVVAVAGGRVARIPLGIDPAVVVWIPATATKTDESRRVLPITVAFDDAVFNIGRVALLVAALASGTIEALAAATHDRLHQPARLRGVPGSAAAIEAALAAGAWCSWLSGSGPTVAALCHRGDAEDVAAHLPADGHTKVLRIDHEGATIEGRSAPRLG